MRDDCIFCRIVAGEADAHKVYEDDRLLAFLDLFPAAPGHTLIITKRHSDDIFDAIPKDIAAVGALSVPLARAVMKVSEADGLGVHQLNKAAAGQSVFHYHMHLIPQLAGRALHIHGRAQGDAASLAEMAERVARALSEERAR